MFMSAHYAGVDLVPKFRNGEYWKKVFGPVFIYLNSAMDDTDPRVLWEDAKLQVPFFLHQNRYYNLTKLVYKTRLSKIICCN